MATLSPPAFVSDFGLLYLLYKATAFNEVLQRYCMAAQLLWMLCTKIVKIFPHFWRYPADIKYLPISILFGYFHGFIKYYALFTLNEVCQTIKLNFENLQIANISINFQTAWGSREGIDDDEDQEEEPFAYNRINDFDVENGGLLDEKIKLISL